VQSESIQRLVVLGYITAVAMPPVGFVLGIVLVIRFTAAESKHGVWIIAISIVALVVWFLLLTSGVVNTTSDN
jgi:general stress protein CsbA